MSHARTRCFQSDIRIGKTVGNAQPPLLLFHALCLCCFFHVSASWGWCNELSLAARRLHKGGEIEAIFACAATKVQIMTKMNECTKITDG